MGGSCPKNKLDPWQTGSSTRQTDAAPYSALYTPPYTARAETKLLKPDPGIVPCKLRVTVTILGYLYRQVHVIGDCHNFQKVNYSSLTPILPDTALTS